MSITSLRISPNSPGVSSLALVSNNWEPPRPAAPQADMNAIRAEIRAKQRAADEVPHATETSLPKHSLQSIRLRHN
jgi:hypothetical protein